MGDERGSALGFQFYADGADAAAIASRPGRELAVIGHLHSPTEFLVAEDTADGSVWVLAADLSAEWPLNASRSAFDACLAAFGRYLDAGPSISGPVVYSADEMRERLERFARGEISARAVQKQPVPHRTRLKRLRSELKTADRSALSSDSWWSGALENAKDDLL
ncbi:SUKH-4 immunity protein of toxin-antitoxin system [Leucobacter komagatae]|uniref:SUKH-4 immunity protein of toxin-antitoxin system n=1 Tax=Leucobacter komagatae TaxID=55969 RepID=A0A542Y624_9MICO|nr:SUKH-4 family immunity protein [Leucobacter komagatae]TQL43548.1 SUKH-4 immunity protein of toxin-antitoxin system [Leucobacter komagatae]